MSNKHQKAVKQEALKRKAELQAVCGEVGLGLNDELFPVGVVLNHLEVSQLNFFLLNSMNEASRRYIGIDVALFALQISKPFLTPLYPIFDIQRMMTWPYPLIATSTSACLEALASKSPLVLHYVFDVDFLDRQDLSTMDLRRAFRDPRVRVITRGEDHRRLVETEFGIRARKTIVPNAEFDLLARILVAETKGDNHSG